MFFLFSSYYQFEPKSFATFVELDTYCRENSIVVCFVNENAKSTKFLCKRWNLPYFKGMYKKTFIGF